MKMFKHAKLTALARQYGTPLYVYDATWLESKAQTLIEACSIMDCQPRYAVKANPLPAIVKLFNKLGLHFDASSDYEVEQLLNLGMEASKISLSSQQPPVDLAKVLNSGVKFVATSLHQLDLVSASGWRGNLAVRVNPSVGSGHSKRTTTGGLGSSFGIWHDYVPNILQWQKISDCMIDRLHIHIGAGVDPKVWQTVIREALTIVKQLPTVTTLDIGGGYKVARVDSESETDMKLVMAVFKKEIEAFEKSSGRQLKLEVEPGTWLVANGGVLLASVVDLVDTGERGYKFIKLDTGMNDILRPSLYGAQHSIEVLNNSQVYEDYVVVGHNCESGDILTTAPGQPEEILARRLKRANIGDTVSIGGVGAYCASMSAHGYNSYPSAKELLVTERLMDSLE